MRVLWRAVHRAPLDSPLLLADVPTASAATAAADLKRLGEVGISCGELRSRSRHAAAIASPARPGILLSREHPGAPGLVALPDRPAAWGQARSEGGVLTCHSTATPRTLHCDRNWAKAGADVCRTRGASSAAPFTRDQSRAWRGRDCRFRLPKRQRGSVVLYDCLSSKAGAGGLLGETLRITRMRRWRRRSPNGARARPSLMVRSSESWSYR
jgi:hypothetical protein